MKEYVKIYTGRCWYKKEYVNVWRKMFRCVQENILYTVEKKYIYIYIYITNSCFGRLSLSRSCNSHWISLLIDPENCKSEVLSCDSHHKWAVFPMAIWKRENYVTRIAECNMVGCKFHAHELHLLDSIAWNSSFSFKCGSKAGCNATENVMYVKSLVDDVLTLKD